MAGTAAGPIFLSESTYTVGKVIVVAPARFDQGWYCGFRLASQVAKRLDCRPPNLSFVVVEQFRKGWHGCLRLWSHFSQSRSSGPSNAPVVVFEQFHEDRDRCGTDRREARSSGLRNGLVLVLKHFRECRDGCPTEIPKGGSSMQPNKPILALALSHPITQGSPLVCRLFTPVAVRVPVSAPRQTPPRATANNKLSVFILPLPWSSTRFPVQDSLSGGQLPDAWPSSLPTNWLLAHVPPTFIQQSEATNECQERNRVSQLPHSIVSPSRQIGNHAPPGPSPGTDRRLVRRGETQTAGPLARWKTIV